MPPEKPPNAVMFYIEHNRGRGLSDEQLKTEFNESLGKQEKQKWKTKHKKAKRKYHKLLNLYAEHHPDFDVDEYNNSSRSHGGGGGRKKNKSRNKRRRGADTYGSRQAYVGITTYDEDTNMPQPATKRRRRGAQQSSGGGHSIDDLFKDLNSGSKRVVRDPDKFKLSEQHKISMQNLVDSMRAAARKGTFSYNPSSFLIFTLFFNFLPSF